MWVCVSAADDDWAFFFYKGLKITPDFPAIKYVYLFIVQSLLVQAKTTYFQLQPTLIMNKEKKMHFP